MSDLVERLRARTEAWIAGRGDCTILVNPDGPEAADKLEAMQAALVEARTTIEVASGKSRAFRNSYEHTLTKIDAALNLNRERDGGGAL